MRRVIRIGSRESRLAVAQAELMKRQIERQHPEFQIELVTMKTMGDKILDRSLEEIGGKGLFVKELDRALLDGKIDIAVHSLKDLPMELLKELPILAYSKREDARDALIWKPGANTFSGEGVIGTSSRRRMVQLRKQYPDASFRGIRGNVQTRLKKLVEESYDATVLAMAGLNRLGMAGVIGRIFSVEEMIPAAGQGILAVQGRKEDGREWLACVNDKESEWAAAAERQFVLAQGGGCTSPAAAYARVSGNEMCLCGLYYQEARDDYVTDKIVGDVGQARKLGEMLAWRMQRETR